MLFAKSRRKKAERLLSRGDYEGARECFSRLNLWDRVAETYELQHRPEEATKAWLQAGNKLRAGKLYAQSHRFLEAAPLFAESGWHLQAARCYQLADDTHSAVRTLVQHRAFKKAAALLESLGEREQAARYYTEAKEFRKAVELYKDLGKQNLVVALCDLLPDKEAIALEWEESGEYDCAAILWEKCGELGRAASLFEQTGNLDAAINLYKTMEEYPKLGELYERKGAIALAAQAYAADDSTVEKAANIYAMLLTPELLQTPTCPTGKIETPGCALLLAKSSSADTLLTAQDSKEVILYAPNGAPSWRMRLPANAAPTSIEISADGNALFVAADDSALYRLEANKNILWQKNCPEPARSLATDSTGDTCLVALADLIWFLDKDANLKQSFQTDFKSWSVALDVAHGKVFASTLSGTIYALDMEARPVAEQHFPERVYRLRLSSDGQFILAGCGSAGVRLLNADLQEVWALNLDSPVTGLAMLPESHHVVVTDAHSIIVMDKSGVLRCRFTCEEQILSLCADSQPDRFYCSFKDKTVRYFTLRDNKRLAAECFERANLLGDAARNYEEIGDYQHAFDLYKQVEQYEKAAEMMHLTGDVRSAAQYYSLAGDFDKAARFYEQVGEPRLAAANCVKAGQFVRAAQLFDSLGENLEAAECYEQAGDFKNAGLRFHSAAMTAKAIENLKRYLETHQEDSASLMQLGKLYAENKQFDEAIRILQSCVPIPELHREALMQLAHCFIESQLYTIAIDRYDECLAGATRVDFNNKDIFYGKARALEFLGRYPDARAIYEKILAVDFYYKDVREHLERVTELSHVYDDAGERKTVKIPAAADPSATLAMSATEERYLIKQILGKGGMGIVYHAVDRKLNRDVALKVLSIGVAGDEEFRQRLVREARAAAKLNHPHIIAVYDIGAEADNCFITMEFVKGKSLRDMLGQAGKLSLSHVLRYALQIADALAAAHDAGIIHRDMKPENVMITDEGSNVKIADFGLARVASEATLTVEGAVMGSPAYMAPEQIRGGKVTTRTDIYATGVMLFEMLAGQRPFTGEDLFAQHLNQPPPHIDQFCPDIPHALADTVMRCLEKKPASRPKNGAELLALLKEIPTA
jgi:tetratricopeptide (TPR) repeat protein